MKLDLSLPIEDVDFAIYFCEPDMSCERTQDKLLAALDLAFSKLSPQAGYYDLPEIRDFVCRHLKIPEVSFEEGVNYIAGFATLAINRWFAL